MDNKELVALLEALCTPTKNEFEKSEKHKKQKKAVESVQKPTPRVKLCFQRYKDSKIKDVDLLKLYFFSKVAENVDALLDGEDI